MISIDRTKPSWTAVAIVALAVTVCGTTGAWGQFEDPMMGEGGEPFSAALVASCLDTLENGPDSAEATSLALLRILVNTRGMESMAIDTALMEHAALRRLGDSSGAEAAAVRELVVARLGLDADSLGSAPLLRVTDGSVLEAFDDGRDPWTSVPLGDDGVTVLRMQLTGEHEHQLHAMECWGRAAVLDADSLELLGSGDIGEGATTFVEPVGEATEAYVRVSAECFGDLVLAADRRLPPPTLEASPNPWDAPKMTAGVYRIELPAEGSVWVQFEASGGRHYRLVTSRLGSVDTVLNLEPNGDNWLASDDDSGPEELASAIDWLCPGDGTYRLNIVNLASAAGPFDLTLIDGGAVPSIAAGETLQRTVAVNGSDMLQLEGAAGTLYELRTHDTELDTVLSVLANGEQVATNDDYGEEGLSLVRVSPGADTVYSVVVTGYGGSGGDYQLTVRTVEIPSLSVGETVERTIDASGKDMFSFACEAGTVYEIQTHDTDFDSVLRVWDGDTELMYVDDVDGSSDAAVFWMCPHSGTFRIEVGSFDGIQGDYALTTTSVGTLDEARAAGAEVAYDGFAIGDRVIVGRHQPIDGEANWIDEMDQYVGQEATITSVQGQGPSGAWLVNLDVDGGAFYWRTRALERPAE